MANIFLPIIFIILNITSGNAEPVLISELNWKSDHTHLCSKLDEDLNDKKVLFLGEASHWVHEKYDFRLIILKCLLSKGFNLIGMEMGISDGERVNHYLQSGNDNFLKQVALYGYSSPWFSGRRMPVVPFTQSFMAEEKWFYSQVYEMFLPSGHLPRHFGFDLDMVLGGGYEDVREILVPYNTHPLVKEFIELIDRITRHPLPDLQATQLEALLVDFRLNQEIISSIIGGKSYSELINSLQMLEAGYHFEQNTETNDVPTILRAMAARERLMFAQIDRIIDRLKSNDKLVFMGHNFHLSKNSDSLYFNSTNSQQTASMWHSVGEYIRSKFPNETFSIWMIHNKGYQSGGECRPSCPVDTGAAYVGNLLSQFGDNFYAKIKDLKGVNLNQVLDFAVNDNGTSSGNLEKNTEAVFFVNEVSPLRER